MEKDKALEIAWSILQRQLEIDVARRKLPGVICLVTDGSSIVREYNSCLNISGSTLPLHKKTPMPIASLSKLLVATMVMHLVQQGRINLHRPIQEFWPEWNKLGPLASNASLAHLLSHTAGLPVEPWLNHWHDYNMPTTVDIVQSLDPSLVKARPGETYHYSNLGYALLKPILESCLGTKDENQWDVLVHDLVFTKYGLTDSYVSDFSSYPIIIPKTVGIMMLTSGFRLICMMDFKGFAPAGGIVSTPSDMAKFIRVLLEGFASHRMGQEILSELLKERHRINDTISALYGWNRVLGETIIYSHTGYMPGFSSLLAMSFVDKMGLVLMTNSSQEQTWYPMPYLYEFLNTYHRLQKEGIGSNKIRDFIGVYVMPGCYTIEVVWEEGQIKFKQQDETLQSSTQSDQIFLLENGEQVFFDRCSRTGQVKCLYLGGREKDNRWQGGYRYEKRY